MWSFISNFTPFATAGGASAAGGAVISPRQVSQPVVVSLSAATLKQVNGMSAIPRTNSRSRLPQDLLSEHSGISDCDMLSDYDFELIDVNVSDWVEIRKSTEASKDGTQPSGKPKPLYSAVAKTPTGRNVSHARAAPIVSTPSVAAQKNARKRHKQARNRKYKTHLRDLEVSQARRLGNTNI